MDDIQQAILVLLKQSADNLSIHEIHSAIDLDVSNRTLQRLINDLINQNLVKKIGKGRATRYCSSSKVITKQKQSTIEVIALSPEASKVKQYVSQELALRQPIGYQHKFLESYIPNHTYYLPLKSREMLAKLGKQPDGEHVAGTFARAIVNRLLIDLSWNSSRLEGNTYSLLDTQRLLEFNEDADGKTALEAQMILNHKDAIEFLLDTDADIKINEYTLCNLHALLANNLLNNPNALGQLRNIPVGVHGTVYYPLEDPALIKEYFQLIINKASDIVDPLEQAFFLMVHIPYLQGFEDVNKRLSRLAANIPLVNHNYCPISFIDLPEQEYIDGVLGVYEKNDVTLLRDIFIWSYQRSIMRYSGIKDSMGEPDKFRLKYRKEISNIIAEIVREVIPPKQISSYIDKWSKERISERELFKFKTTIENEIIGLGEGNIARYKITPKEYKIWSSIWKKSNKNSNS